MSVPPVNPSECEVGCIKLQFHDSALSVLLLRGKVKETAGVDYEEIPEDGV